MNAKDLTAAVVHAAVEAVEDRCAHDNPIEAGCACREQATAAAMAILDELQMIYRHRAYDILPDAKKPGWSGGVDSGRMAAYFSVSEELNAACLDIEAQTAAEVTAGTRTLGSPESPREALLSGREGASADSRCGTPYVSGVVCDRDGGHGGPHSHAVGGGFSRSWPR